MEKSSKSMAIMFTLAALFVAGLIVFVNIRQNEIDKIGIQPPIGKACPMLAKLCPDGSSVSMSGPNCEFVPCPQSNNTIVGNDKDEHGCIGSAGYQWCEEKQKCLRSWEESCIDTSNWKTYRNDEYGFEFKYPSNFIKRIKTSEDAILSLEKKESVGVHTIDAIINKNRQISEINNNENFEIEGLEANKYFFHEGAGYTGVFQIQLNNDSLEIDCEVVGTGALNEESIIQSELNDIISTFKITK